MLVGHDRNLRQVGYDNHLMRGGKIGQDTGQRTGGGAADTGIDLVEHKRIHAVRITEDNLTRQHDAAQLAARRNAAQGTRCQAGAAAIQKLIARRTRGCPLSAREIAGLPDQLSAAHLQACHLTTHLVTKTRGCRIARTLERLGGGEQFMLRRAKRFARLLDLFIAIVYQRQQLLRATAHGKHVVHGRTPLPQKSL